MLNLRKLLNITDEERVKYEPYVIPIGGRAEVVAKAYEERQKLGLDANTFAIYLQPGWLTLDSILLSMPKAQGEFVIVHELVHLLAPKHGKLFKLFMHAYLPDWEERERRLQEYAGAKGS